MSPIEKQVLDFVALATPKNDNRQELVLLPQKGVDELLAGLNTIRFKGYVDPEIHVKTA